MKKNILLLFFVLVTSFAFAQQEEHTSTDTICIEETIVKAFRAVTHSPFTFSDMTIVQIDKINLGQEPSEILATLPAIHSYSDAGNYQGYSYFRLRGIDQTRININLDGIPLNETEDQGAYFSNYPDFFNSVENFQVQRGVGTSANGVASYAGSISFRSPSLYAKPKLEVGANYGSYNTSHVYAEYKSGLVGNKAIYLRASHLKSDGYKHHSANESYSGFFGIGWLANSHHWKLIGFIGNQKNDMAWAGVSLQDIQTDSRTNANTDKERDNFSQALFALQHTYTLSNNAKISSSVYYNYLKGNYDFDFNNFFNYPAPIEVYNYNFQHHFTGAFSKINVTWHNLELAAGVHANAFQRRHIGAMNAVREYENHGYKKEFSAFAKANYRLASWNFFADLQYRHANFDYEGNVDFEKMNWDFVNPRLGASFTSAWGGVFYYSFGATQREPTRNDIFGGWDNLVTNSEGEPQYSIITPEQVMNHEIGIRMDKQNWSLDFNLYQMNFSDEIVLNGQFGPNGLALHSNVAKSYRRGMELAYTWSVFKTFVLRGNMSLSDNEIEQNNTSISPILSPNFILNQSVEYQHKALLLAAQLRYQSESFIDFENKHTLPEYTQVDTRAAYEYKNWRLTVGAKNIFDKQILANGSVGSDGSPLYFVSAPRNYFIALRWKL